jgi:hypothetical protein
VYRLTSASPANGYAGQGVNESNCHPFHCGRYVFMHNGEVGGIHKIRRILMSKMSERAFLYACEVSCPWLEATRNSIMAYRSMAAPSRPAAFIGLGAGVCPLSRPGA